jgi:hypothetical protein
MVHLEFRSPAGGKSNEGSGWIYRKEVRTMAYKTRRILEEENEALREKLEEARDLIDDALGIEECQEEEVEDPSEDVNGNDEDET